MNTIQGFQRAATKSCSLPGVAFYIPMNVEKENHIFCCVFVMLNNRVLIHTFSDSFKIGTQY